MELEKVINAKLQEVNSNENKLTEMKINKATLDEAIEGKKNEFSRMEKEIQDLSSKSKLLTQENIDNQNSIETLNSNIKENIGL
ncbi:putative nuclease with TOPRIM domain [Clostridium saccharobutylicum]|nr:putative nuclease with TOPRIM domain [Clostridium saccharobutylicum]